MTWVADLAPGLANSSHVFERNTDFRCYGAEMREALMVVSLPPPFRPNELKNAGASRSEFRGSTFAGAPMGVRCGSTLHSPILRAARSHALGQGMTIGARPRAADQIEDVADDRPVVAEIGVADEARVDGAGVDGVEPFGNHHSVTQIAGHRVSVELPRQA